MADCWIDFELTNDQRRCFALEPVEPDWEKIELKPNQFDLYDTFAYLSGNTIRKLICVGERIYAEQSFCEAVTEAKKETGGMRFKTVPEIQAACVFHRGSYRTFAESYETVLRYIEENGYEIAGEIRESYIDGVWNRDDESQWLSEIQVPVRRKTV